MRRIFALAAATALTVTAGLLPAVPALAHGATTQPISRTAACAAGGPNAGGAACRAALKANGQPFGSFDNLRVPNVAGRDRQEITDGHLCSGDLAAYRGLDLARDDWPATRLPAGTRMAIRYAGTIRHEGTFRVYLTRAGYDPAKKLTWADLGSKPLVTVANPPYRDGAYRMSAQLPAGRTGRQVLYVVWQTSSTPDTYYSCSDLDLTAPEKPAVAARKPSPSAKAIATPTATTPTATAKPRATPRTSTAAGVPFVRTAGTQPEISTGQRLLLGAVIALAVGTGLAAFARIRRARSLQEIHRRSEIR